MMDSSRSSPCPSNDVMMARSCVGSLSRSNSTSSSRNKKIVPSFETLRENANDDETETKSNQTKEFMQDHGSLADQVLMLIYLSLKWKFKYPIKLNALRRRPARRLSFCWVRDQEFQTELITFVHLSLFDKNHVKNFQYFFICIFFIRLVQKCATAVRGRPTAATCPPSVTRKTSETSPGDYYCSTESEAEWGQFSYLNDVCIIRGMLSMQFQLPASFIWSQIRCLLYLVIKWHLSWFA